jgi:hypothetical protein
MTRTIPGAWTTGTAANDTMHLARMQELFGRNVNMCNVDDLCLHRVGSGSPPECPYDGVACPVSRSAHPRVLDHMRFWQYGSDGMRFATAEPYAVAGESLARLAAECDQLGLAMVVSGKSPYYPGRTMLIAFALKSYCWPGSLNAG